MSETPTIPVLDQRSEHITTNVEQRHLSGQVDRDFAAWEHGFDSEARFNLNHDDALNANLWTDTTPSTIEAPIQAAAPRSRAQEIEEPLFYMSKEALVMDARNVSRAVVTLRQQTLRAHSKQAYALAA